MAIFNFMGLGGLELIIVTLILVMFAAIIGLWIKAFLRLIRSDMPPIEKILWLLLILFMPVIGPIVFIIFSRMSKPK